MTTRVVTLCADDYAMSEGVSRGIAELIERGRLLATGAMTNAAGWPRLAAPLAGLRDRAAIGLHLNLTFGGPLGRMPGLAPAGELPPLGTLLRGALLGRLPLDEIAAEIERQLSAFVEATGHEPDFVDGHQHVHVLPGIRGALLRALSRRTLPERFWLRDPGDRPSAILSRSRHIAKAGVVAALAGGFARQVEKAGYRVNEGFSGFSDFDPREDLAQAFESYFDAPGPRHLVMCHPGYVDGEGRLDRVVEARARELAYLNSPAFADLLRRRDLSLVPNPV